MEFSAYIDLLRERLQDPLPGVAAQLRMSSLARARRLMKFLEPAGARPSGVLILLYPLDGSTGLVLIQRPDYRGVHGGQISLPGGKQEEGDFTLVETALREASEEIGIDAGKVEILGTLTNLYIPPSNFLVTPVVGAIDSRPVFRADPTEVADIIEIKVPDLLNDRHCKRTAIRLPSGIPLRVPAYVIDNSTIWGATAMILSEFKEIIRNLADGSSVTFPGQR